MLPPELTDAELIEFIADNGIARFVRTEGDVIEECFVMLRQGGFARFYKHFRQPGNAADPQPYWAKVDRLPDVIYWPDGWTEYQWPAPPATQ